MAELRFNEKSIHHLWLMTFVHLSPSQYHSPVLIHAYFSTVNIEGVKKHTVLSMFHALTSKVSPDTGEFLRKTN